MSSSGLIYAVIVGAWAAYLVPMWLRRQDELNEARPTERFSTAIRLLSGRGAMERRYAKELRERTEGEAGPGADPDAVTDRLNAVDVRGFAAPRAESRPDGRPDGRSEPRPESRPDARLDGRPEAPARPQPSAQPAPAQAAPAHPGPAQPVPAQAAPRGRRPRPSPGAAERARRGKALARRRRTTTLLFLGFTLGSIVAAVGGLGFLWVPAVPAVLLSAYIGYLRRQERQRFVVVMDRRRAEIAAQRLRERGRPQQGAPAAPAEPLPEPEARPEPELPALSPQAADRRALVEQTDHAEWVDQQRASGPASGSSWDPVPVPLPTYVTAPVAPRATGGVDLSDPDTWSSARSSAADPAPADPVPQRRVPRERGRTPLFDQYAEDDDRPRAANE
ncbi:gephyrin-like molybdotransferase receptor GlpR [Streptomyces sp. NPDC000594]|uniref:divisome protein SepX/GlpR n=1 Tax=Streptomyces sp. NPDC000594 TaxID=3154261 RepID=UPI00332F1AA7